MEDRRSLGALSALFSQVGYNRATSMDDEEAVILVVGNEEKDKSDVIEMLAQGDAWEKQTTSAGCRLFTRKFPSRVIIDTTVLRSITGRSPVATARRWISQNSLRRILYGKLVFVVCVVRSSITIERCNWDIFYYSNCWLDIFGLIFDENRSSMMIVVNTQGNHLDLVKRSQVKRFVKEHKFLARNIVYSDLRKGDDLVRRVIEESVSLGEIVRNKKQFFSFNGLKKVLPSSSPTRELRASCSSCFSARRRKPAEAQQTGKYFYIPANSCGAFRMREILAKESRFGPWGPERVILFGRTGSGKSTLAQMLTMGKLDPSNGEFPTTSSIRGGTRNVDHGEGRGWYVVDTPGFGEPKGQDSTITTKEAENKIKQYVKKVEGTFSHYLYVVKKDRLDLLEERLWKFFVELFGEEITHQFSVVLSGADYDWVQQNICHLQDVFIGCQSFLPVDFPPTNLEDDEIESELRIIRTESLAEFEDEIASLGRVDLHCKYGERSQMHIANERERANLDMRIEKDIRIKVLVSGANAVFALGDVLSNVISPFSQLTSLLRVDDQITLLPL